MHELTQPTAALTLRWLARSWDGSSQLIICTGERLQDLIKKLYGRAGVRATDFDVVHAGLKNEFYCYANFEKRGVWQWKSSE